MKQPFPGEGRYMHAVCVINEKIYVIAGSSYNTGDGVAFSDVWEYDPSKNI